MYTDECRHLNGAWLHYQDWPEPQASRTWPGRPAGETLFLLHGLTQQSHVFDAVAA